MCPTLATPLPVQLRKCLLVCYFLSAWENWWLCSWSIPSESRTHQMCLPGQTSSASLLTHLGCSEDFKLFNLNGRNHSLLLKHLSWKITMLLALSRPSKSADLSKLDLSRRVYKPDGVCFYPSTLAKQSRSTSQITNFFSPYLPEEDSLCPVSTLKESENRTKSLRGGRLSYLYYYQTT